MFRIEQWAAARPPAGTKKESECSPGIPTQVHGNSYPSPDRKPSRAHAAPRRGAGLPCCSPPRRCARRRRQRARGRPRRAEPAALARRARRRGGSGVQRGRAASGWCCELHAGDNGRIGQSSAELQMARSELEDQCAAVQLARSKRIRIKRKGRRRFATAIITSHILVVGNTRRGWLMSSAGLVSFVTWWKLFTQRAMNQCHKNRDVNKFGDARTVGNEG